MIECVFTCHDNKIELKVYNALNVYISEGTLQLEFSNNIFQINMAFAVMKNYYFHLLRYYFIVINSMHM